MSVLRYLLDENLAHSFRRALLRAWPDLTVWMVGDPGTPPRGSLDPDILLWCEANRFVLVTNNRRSMPLHLAHHLDTGHHVPGILVLRGRASMRELIDDLILIAVASTADEHQDQIDYVPLR